MGDRPVTAAIRDRADAISWAQFNRYWVSQSFAQGAGQVLNVGYPLIAAVLLDLGPSQVAVTTALQFIPYLVVTPVAGMIVDRVNRVRLVLTCHVSRAVLLALAGMLAAEHSLTALIFWTVVALSGSVNALASIGTLALVPDLAPEGGLVKANGRLQLSMSITQVIGPAVAGGLLALSGDLVLFAISAAFAVAAVLIVRTRARQVDRFRAREPWMRSFVAGVAFVRRVRMLWILLLRMTLFNFFEQAVITLFMLFALRELDLGSVQVGLVLGAGAVGSVVGASTASRFQSPRGVTVIMIVSTGMASFSPGALPFVPAGSALTSMAVGSIAFCCYGFGLTVFNVHSNAVRHELAPRELQGRLAAVFRTCAFSSIALGASFAGVLAEAVTYRMAIGLSCVGLILSFFLFVTLLTRTESSGGRQPAASKRS